MDTTSYVIFANKYWPNEAATSSNLRAADREAQFLLFLSEQTNNPQYEDEATCVHGLSEWLCEGPSHYPLDHPSMQGYF